MSKYFKIIVLLLCIAVVLANTLIKTKDNKSKNKNSYYSYWKKNYVESVSENVDRVVDLENGSVTVSEGMGYGLLFSVAANDEEEFKKLWNYTEKYLDENGLMNWKISSNGSIEGFGAATDADEDIAYALMLAAKKWNSKSYYNSAVNMIAAIRKYEISKNYVLMPGDKWGDNIKINPSYIAPAYYIEFGKLSTENENYWSKVLEVNLAIMSKASNNRTGFLPDWINEDGSIEEKENILGYEAIRVPLRLLQFYKKTNNSTAKEILKRENTFISNVGEDKLVAGYNLKGEPLVSYINTAYLSTYSAISTIDEGSSFNKDMLRSLQQADDKSYYGCSLKMWLLFIINGELK